MWVTAALAVLLLSGAQGPPVQAEPPDTVEEVVVTAKRAEEQRKAVSEFVKELAAPTQRGRLARWDQGVCPGIVGLPSKHATYLADRIAVEAQTIGLDVGRPGCRPDILVLFAADASATAAELRARHPAYFAPVLQRNRLEAGEGREALQAFLTSERPVRSWHVSRLAAADGRPVGWFMGAPAVETTVSSRIASNWRNDLARVMLIVDAKQMKGVSYEQLASYLSMVSLAQLDPDAAPTQLPSIVRLFTDRDAGRAPPETLTEWDRAYLQGLYRAPANAKNLGAQRGAIARTMRRSPPSGSPASSPAARRWPAAARAGEGLRWPPPPAWPRARRPRRACG